MKHRPTIRTLIFLASVLCAASVNADTIVVPAGGSVQSAINSANPGDTIILQAGATYNANLTLPVKTGSGVITIQSSRAAELPIGVRVGPAQSALFAKLQSTVNGEPVIKTVSGARGYRFIGLEITTQTPTTTVFDLVRWGEDKRTQNTLASIPSDLSIDRSYIHGWPTQNVQRGVSFNCANCEVINSYISDIHLIGADSQAICAWNGPGPFRIINNYLEAAGENIMFGGADPGILNLVPSDIEIRNNHLFKPLSWKIGDPTYAGIHWAVKNLLEFKNARNVIVDGNVLENSWGDAQIGYAVLFTVRNQDGTAPWSTIENVTFTNNLVRNSEQGFQLLGMDNLQPSQRASGLQIVNNLFTGIKNRFFTMNGYLNVTLDHNTHEQGGNITLFNGATPSTGFRYTNNVTTRMPAGYGVFGDNVGEGNAALNTYTPGHVFAGNVIAGARLGADGKVFDWTRLYSTASFYPLDLTDLTSFKGTDGLVPGFMGLPAQPLPSPSPVPNVSPSPSPSPTATSVPSPTPTPVPSPTVEAREVLSVTVPPDENSQVALWKQLNIDNWNCTPMNVVTGNKTTAKLRCWRVQQR